MFLSNKQLRETNRKGHTSHKCCGLSHNKVLREAPCKNTIFSLGKSGKISFVITLQIGALKNVKRLFR